MCFYSNDFQFQTADSPWIWHADFALLASVVLQLEEKKSLKSGVQSLATTHCRLIGWRFFGACGCVLGTKVHQICENTFTVTSHLIICIPFTCSVFMRANNIPFPPRTLRLAEGKKDGRQTAGLGGKGVSARWRKLRESWSWRGCERDTAKKGWKQINQTAGVWEAKASVINDRMIELER